MGILLVLIADGDDSFIGQGHAQAKYLYPLAGIRDAAYSKGRDFAAAGRGPNTDYVVSVQDILVLSYAFTVLLKGRNGYLNGDAVDIGLGNGVMHDIGPLARRIAQIKNTAEIDKEGIIYRSAVDFFACAGGGNGLGKEALVASCSQSYCRLDGPCPDIGGEHGSVGDDYLKTLPTVDASFEGVGSFAVLFS